MKTPRPDSWVPRRGKDKKKKKKTQNSCGNCGHGDFCVHTWKASANPAQLLFTALGENGSYVLCSQLSHRGETTAAQEGRRPHFPPSHRVERPRPTERKKLILLGWTEGRLRAETKNSGSQPEVQVISATCPRRQLSKGSCE